MPYKIGSTEMGMTDLASLATPVIYPIGKEHFQPYSLYKKLGDGTRQGYGLPRAKWVFPQLSQEERDQLKEYFTTGVSDAVYISTRLPDDTYVDYACDGFWPEEEQFKNGDFQNFVIEFINMEALA